jgi:arylsulfatase A-like enzyme
MTKVGLPGAAIGMRAEEPNIPELLKPQGYAAERFGKNHFGDRDEHLPTMHGFDKYFGNLYHPNAKEEPEPRDYPNPADFPEFRKKSGPRGVLHCWADGKGGQKIENTGPLTKKRMETVDEEFLAAATKFIKASDDSGKPFFVWFNTTHMHFRTHTREQDIGRSGRWQSAYHDTMLFHDECVRKMLDLLDELGIADNPIVMYSTDNGPHMNSWPNVGMTPFRNEMNSNWEGAYRVPCMGRWPGHIPASLVSNEIVSHLDFLPTFVAAAGDADIKSKLLKGHEAGGKTFKVHLDGYNLLPYMTGEASKSPRNEFLHFNDDGDLVGPRHDNWKIVFVEQRTSGTMHIWAEPFVTLRVPKIFNLRTDPYERADITSNTYWDWIFDHVYLLVPAQAVAGEFLTTFQEFPPRQTAASFSVDQVVAKLTEVAAGSMH